MSKYFGEYDGFFQAVGVICTAYFAINGTTRLLRYIAKHFLPGLLTTPANLREAGSWAAVTGATDGIGKAYAEQLAAKGLNVVLISRTLSKLETMAKEVENKHRVEVKVIAADYSKEDIYDDVRAKISGIDLGVLVNNVGCAYPDHPEYFAEVDDADISKKMIHTNCTSVAMMTKIALDMMVPKKKGFIINIGSAAGSVPVPLLGLYSGTKAFVEMFTRSLQHEYGPRGIVIQHVKPYFVVSKMSRLTQPSTFVPSAGAYVRNALRLVGVDASTTGYWAHELQIFFLMHFLPRSVLMKSTMAKMNASRLAGLKKKAESKED